ncbi:MAG TPA: amidohydrolase family protein [Actinotalea sp.]|nr:amidohydrolase family protein [Actinotalea sp.]
MPVTLRYGRLVRSILFHNGVIHSRTDPFAQAVLVADGQIAWLGGEDSLHAVLDGADEVVDLDGALVAPAFVDAHAHLLETGFALVGLDLGPTPSLVAALDALSGAARDARAAGALGPLLGHGWDETRWPEGRPPTRAEVDRATGGAPVHLERYDGHGAVVSTAFAEIAGCTNLPGWTADGWVTGAAHRRARAAARHVNPARRDELHRSALAAAAAAGIVSVHEHAAASSPAAPAADLADLAALLAATAEPRSGLPGVLGYWSAPCETSDDARALLDAVPGLAGIGADVDGSLGSRTAGLRHPYADAPTTGELALTAEQVANHVASVTRAGSRAVLHVTGDRALDETLVGLRVAAGVEGIAAVRAAGHRLENLAMVDASALATIVLLGLAAGVQPALAARGAVPGGEHLRRLGPARAASVAPWADLAGAGVPLAVGSGSPAGPFDPWAAIRAAIEHEDPSQRISARAAFRAHTRGGWRVAGLDATGAGEIRLGAPADLAVWRTGPLGVQAPDGRLAAWSTDPRAGTPLLPELGAGLPAPQCVQTLRAGVVVHDRLG